MSVRRLVRVGGTTPGLMLTTGVALVLISLLAGLLAVLAVGERADAAKAVATGSEPLGVKTQEIYRALADADATAAAGLLEGGVESADVRQRYQQAIETASRTLVQAASAGASGKVAEQLTVIGVQLPEYARLVERARAETRQGNTVGAAYLRSASKNVMRAKILPAATALHEMAEKRLSGDHRDATSTPWVPLSLLLISAASFGGALWFFARRTHRRVNIGLAVAGLATLVSIGWLWVGTESSRTDLDRSRSDGWGPVETLAQARFLTLQAHGDESLTLVMRGSDNGQYQNDFNDVWGRLVGVPARDGHPAVVGMLARAEQVTSSDPTTLAKVRAAQAAARDWEKAHKDVVDLYGDGKFEQAVALVTKADGASRVAFTRIDEALHAAVAEDQKDFEDSVRAGRQGLDNLDIGLGVLALIAAAATVDGVRREVGRYNRP
ncbi:hypothetical protein [Embleya scabrispora]|uniref:hypothetical protein n=1 Tax=Embleya scabrispora TaxID=159449 RepID=UPI000377B5CC|nr:hypothetical protein [Embleya scabrispora]MYS84309.1 hypothetical protein [Streptomyces sp. SID5474]